MIRNNIVCSILLSVLAVLHASASQQSIKTFFSSPSLPKITNQFSHTFSQNTKAASDIIPVNDPDSAAEFELKMLEYKMAIARKTIVEMEDYKRAVLAEIAKNHMLFLVELYWAKYSLFPKLQVFTMIQSKNLRDFVYKDLVLKYSIDYMQYQDPLFYNLLRNLRIAQNNIEQNKLYEKKIMECWKLKKKEIAKK